MEDVVKKIYDYSLEEIMGIRFGRYSKYIIQDRAIPDVRDGLKPVQRRILYTMYESKYIHTKPFKKSARVVGDVMGKYHPHGDSSIYDAMVRMSQDWKTNAVLIDMEGNNGSIDGDSPAAMRYTEARLSKVASEMLKDIEKDTVTFAPNYDDSLMEPTVLPAKFPNLLVNGATGISAGYATNIPPHNLGEIIDATIYRIDSPNCRLETIMDIVKGPDFPTGGCVYGLDGIKSAFENGRGKVVVRARARIEKNKIIINEIPFDVNMGTLVKKIDEIRIDKKIEGIVAVIDNFSKDGLEITIELKKDAKAEMILNYLYKNTELQVNYSYNMIAIVDRCPKQLGIVEILDAYIRYQKEVIRKRSEFDLRHANKRFHITEGLIKAISILDEIIKIIRASKNKADSINNLVKEYDFTEEQATAIVDLQLYRLSNTDIMLLKNDLENLTKIIKALEAILSDENKLKSVIKEELRRVKKEYATSRKSDIFDTLEEIKIDTTLTIPKEDVVVAVTKDGYLKRVSLRSYKSSNNEEITLKENDYIIGLYNMNTMDTLLLFTDRGNYIYLPVYEIPDLKWKEMGKHISNIVTTQEVEKIIGTMPVTNFDVNTYVTSFSSLGMVKRTKLSEFKVQRYSKPINMMKLKERDKMINISYSQANDVLVVTKKGYGLWFDTTDISVVGLKASGVKAINLKDDEVVKALIFDQKYNYVTLITDKATGKRLKMDDIVKTNRANRGILLMKEIKSNPSHILDVYIEDIKTSLTVITDQGVKEIRLVDIPIMDRVSNGSYLVKDKLIEVFKKSELILLTNEEEPTNWLEEFKA